MATLQRRTHHVNVADTLKAKVHATVGELNNHVLHRLIVIVRVDEIGRAHFTSQFEFLRIGINSQNTPGFCLHCALNHRQANTAQTKYGYKAKYGMRSIDEGVTAINEGCNVLGFGFMDKEELGERLVQAWQKKHGA